MKNKILIIIACLLIASIASALFLIPQYKEKQKYYSFLKSIKELNDRQRCLITLSWIEASYSFEGIKGMEGFLRNNNGAGYRMAFNSIYIKHRKDFLDNINREKLHADLQYEWQRWSRLINNIDIDDEHLYSLLKRYKKYASVISDGYINFLLYRDPEAVLFSRDTLRKDQEIIDDITHYLSKKNIALKTDDYKTIFDNNLKYILDIFTR